VTVVSPQCERDFDALFRGGYRRLARLLYRVTGDFARAEEVASEAFWRLHLKPPRRDTNLEGWLYRTGLRLALDHLKKERRRARYESLAAAFRLADLPVVASDERVRVRAILAALKPAQASLILLRAEGFSYAEAAAALALNPASVGTQLARAEAAFRKEYIRRYGTPKGT
jgi:RNA polymerase sigma-70 factor (ECF subfamily)